VKYFFIDKKFSSLLKVFRFFGIYGIRKTLFKIVGRSRGKFNFLQIFLLSKNNNPDIAVIGCGQFTFSTVGQVISRKYGNRFIDCYDIDPQASDSFATFYEISNHSFDSESLFNNKSVEYVYIASNHASHSNYAISALSKGKNVYIEKPIAVNKKQLSKLLKCVNNSSNSIYAGYNRPFSKAILDLKNHIIGIGDIPITLNCFVSAHKIPSDHWYRDNNEGTRICGNVGHWIDLAVHMLSWTILPDSWDIQLVYSNPNATDDDMTITLTSLRGDLIVIVITSRSEPFEGINETINFQQGNVICKIDDFRLSTIWNNNEFLKHKYNPKDVGHSRAICQPFEDKYSREWGEVVKSTLLMLHIADMVKNSNKHSSFSFVNSMATINH
jgi:predicted dehydrogenase